MSTDYLGSVLTGSGLAEAIERTVACIKKCVGEENFDAIAFRGMSGALVAPAVAAKLKKDLILVRKEGDSTHSRLRVESHRENYYYIIIDDFVSSGSTVNEIVKAVREDGSLTTLVAIVLYSGGAWEPNHAKVPTGIPVYLARE